jgi:dolichol-phosphate mannosyltransferase
VDVTPSSAPGPDPHRRVPAGGDRSAAARDLVVIPTYNEREAIGEIIPAILEQPLPLEILVVDDGSPDGTAARVRQLAAADPRIHLMERERKQGLGSAYVAAFRHALENTGAQLVYQMDADFSHDPAALPQFAAAAREVDVVLGSRYLRGVTVVNWPLRRLFLSFGANWYTRRLTGLPVKDATGGFKCWRREALASLDWSRIRSDGYAFQIETTFHAWRQGFRIREIPIVFVDRRAGVSKMNRRIVWEAIFLVWRLGLTRWLRRSPRPRTPRGSAG